MAAILVREHQMVRVACRKKWLLSAFLIATLPLIAIWLVGSFLAHPAKRNIGLPPDDLPARSVVIRDSHGMPIFAWFVPGVEHQGAILLLHGVRADRRSMIDRARFLHATGYSVLMIDFQASGASPGRAITFGYREADDVLASLRYLHQRLPGERVGIIATSMGGAATILAEPHVDADAVVMEQVYPTIQRALEDRLTIYLGPMGRWLTPVLLATLHAHEGIYPNQLRPIDHIGQLAMPKLLIVGDRDRRTTITESYAMYDAAIEPKELWVVHGAAHVDLCRYASATYKVHVLAFLNAHLRAERVTNHAVPSSTLYSIDEVMASK
jgi:alpha-beta hydrolase superfamily lysophospholipase